MPCPFPPCQVDLLSIKLKSRLRTLVDKKKVLQSRTESISRISANYLALQEGFQQFQSELNKIQQFVDLNATAFSKILKKVAPPVTRARRELVALLMGRDC